MAPTPTVPAHVQNPFVTHKLDDTARLPAGDVPDLHADILSRFTDMLGHAKQSGQGIGFLVVGEAGCGKSHMIAQLRSQLAAIPSVVLVSVPMKGAYAGRLWRHLRERFVSELLREYGTGSGSNGLVRILRNRFPNWAHAVQSSSPGGVLGWILGKSGAKADLGMYLNEPSDSGPLHYQFSKVLTKVSDATLSPLAHQWLRGQQLGGEDLALLGLPSASPSELDLEVTAREVVLSLLRLAGSQTTVVLCFDEVEAIQSSNWDAAVLREFTTLVTDLLGETGPRVVATFMRPSLKTEIDKAVEVSNVQKMSQFDAAIPALTWEQVVRIVVVRADAEPTCQAIRSARPASDHWPVGTAFLEDLHRAERKLTPRHVIRACSVEFDRLKAGGTATTAAGNQPQPGTRPETPQGHTLQPQPTPEPEDNLPKMLDYLRKKYRKSPQAIRFDSVLGIALPLLAELADLGLTSANTAGSQYGDFSLLFRAAGSAGQPLGVSFCSQDPKALWHKQDKLLARWAEMKGKLLSGAVVMRAADAPTSKGVVERFDRMRAGSIRVLMLTTDQLAEVAAFQKMFTDATTGDLTLKGKPVEKEEFTAWAKGNLTDIIKRLLEEVFVPQATPAAPASVAAPAGRSARATEPAAKKPAARTAAKVKK